ncbi:hypothetical protein B6N31_04720 [Dickeya fangzhongdai]|nr:hypothetical protein B6N31_04720 [Dickeya fangzhongdai]
MCNCLILICSIQHQNRLVYGRKQSRNGLTNWPKIPKPLRIFSQFDSLLRKISVKAAIRRSAAVGRQTERICPPSLLI